MASSQPARRLTIGWALVFGLGVWTGTTVILGVRRDARADDSTIPLSLGETSDWRRASFRVWGDATYNLFVSTVNFEQRRVGTRFRGEIEVAIRRPDGTVLFERRFGPDSMPHTMPYNYGDTMLATLAIEAARLRPCTVAVRVVKPDQGFAGVSSELKLWRERVDAGMGGLLTYVLIIPAMVFVLLADYLSFALARRGRRGPLVASLIVTLVFFLAFVA